MNKKIVYALLIFFSLFVLALAFHHHKDGVAHDACLLCFNIFHHSELVSQYSPQVSAPSFNTLLVLIGNTVNIPFLYYYPYSNRAPPA